jgi:hypothetical protein
MCQTASCQLVWRRLIAGIADLIAVLKDECVVSRIFSRSFIVEHTLQYLHMCLLTEVTFATQRMYWPLLYVV